MRQMYKNKFKYFSNRGCNIFYLTFNKQYNRESVFIL